MPVPLESRVLVPVSYIGEGRSSYSGTVVGIAATHIIFTYIVLLDEPVEDPQYGGMLRAITVDGCNLRDTLGNYAWRKN